MGASISQRPGKCLKSRRTKSEEYLDTKRNPKNAMGRFSTRWHDIISENIVNGNQENGVNHSGVFECSDWINNKEFSSDMEKSFKEIHRSNSLDKSSFENDYHNLIIDYSHDAIDVDQTQTDSPKRCNRRLTINVNKDAIFEVNLHKGSRGLGFSVLEYDGFIFIKQLFPLEAASQSGALQEGDIILSANGNTLADLSSFEALQILRKLDNPVTLIVCRLQQFTNKKSTTSSQNYSTNFTPAINGNSQYKEFEIEMKKINGSLGFTLKKDEDGHHNHIVRALVKNPAISDGRIKPGDQIISVNGREICEMSHQEAVKFLRECDEEVVLKLRRDTLSSSLTSLSSSHIEDNNRTLRKEAVDMLNTLAVKKMKAECEDKQNNNSSHGTVLQSSILAPNESHLKRNDILFDSASENLSSLLAEECHAVPTFVRSEDHDMVDKVEKLADGPVSLPALDVKGDKINFQHNEPAYRSINVPNFTLKNSEDSSSQSRLSPVPPLDNKGLLKWKGIVLDTENRNSSQHDGPSEETVVVQLQRNWNSRLGFSLSRKNGVTVISAIHPDSVAFKDGRLKVDDIVIEVNGKDVKNRETNEIIDMLRTVRGTVTIKVNRKSFSVL